MRTTSDFFNNMTIGTKEVKSEEKYYFLHVFDITLSIHLYFYHMMLFSYHFPGRIFLLIFDLPILCHLEKSCHSISRILITSLNLLFSSNNVVKIPIPSCHSYLIISLFTLIQGLLFVICAILKSNLCILINMISFDRSFHSRVQKSSNT